MVGRGKTPVTRGRKATSATEEGPSEEQSLQFILKDILARVQAMEERDAVRHVQPVEQPAVVPQVQLAASAVVMSDSTVPEDEGARVSGWLRPTGSSPVARGAGRCVCRCL